MIAYIVEFHEFAKGVDADLNTLHYVSVSDEAYASKEEAIASINSTREVWDERSGPDSKPYQATYMDDEDDGETIAIVRRIYIMGI